ncbi:complement decay-accelerating factor-like [Scomber scombrus]|uniref:Complement decay-accelerating factor-like n=1 Tax=Scomber scombrus TaxID=13677 RepID=A0AAV1QPA2_SCOSC
MFISLQPVMDVLLDTCCGRLDVKSLLFLTLHLFLLKAAADCPKPKPGENMVVSNKALLLNSFPEGIEVELECANGYVKDSGSEIINCINENWSNPELICKKKDCGLPKSRPNMTFKIITDTLFGAKIRVSCDKGYEISGASTNQCFATGWSGRSKCEIVKCETLPGEVANGKSSWSSEDYPEYGQTIQYKCNDGYTLVGNDTIMCDEDGEYHPQPPKCKEASTATESTTETTHSDQTIPATTVSPLATVSSSTRGGRDMLTVEDDTTATNVTPATTSLSGEIDKQDGTETVDGNKDVGYTPVIISVFTVLLVVCIVVAFTHKYLLRRKGSGTVTII